MDQRESKIDTSIIFPVDSPLPELAIEQENRIELLAEKIKQAKERQSPVVLLYGAHLFRNGLSLFIKELLEAGFLSHLVSNGAGAIHDWELAFHGKTTEDVSKYINIGQFGIWEETGFYQNLAVILGAAKGIGYGKSIAKMIADDQLSIPSVESLKDEMRNELNHSATSSLFAAKAALLNTIERFELGEKKVEVVHPHKDLSILFNAYRLGIPIGICPGIGYDIIYTHAINSGASIGEAALFDFLELADSVSKMDGGVIIVVGSAVMASQVMEKAVSMANNLRYHQHKPLNSFHIAVADIQPGNWEWSNGEPPKDNPAYYLRFCKSFSRLSDDFTYLQVDNRAFIHQLFHKLTNS